MAYKVIILYQLYMPSYFLGTFTEYPKILTNDYELFFGLYSDIVKQREKAKIQVKEDMPVLTVIEPVVEPTVPSKPQRALIVLASLLLGLFVGCGFVLIQPIFSQIVSSKKQAHTIPIKRMKKIS